VHALKHSIALLAVIFSITVGTLTARAAVVTSYIFAEAETVGGNPFGNAIAIGDLLTGTVGFDADNATNPFTSLSVQVNGITYEMTFDAGTQSQIIDGMEYRLSVNLGLLNPGGNEQWLVNGVPTLVDLDNPGGRTGVLRFFENLSNAPTSAPLRSLDSSDWDEIYIALTSGFDDFVLDDFALFRPVAVVPEPSTALLSLVGVGPVFFGRPRRARKA